MTVKYFIQYVVSPMKLFGSIGLAFIGASITSGLVTTWMKVQGHVDMFGNPLLLLAAMTAMVGVQFLSFGILGELCSRIYFAAQNQTNYTIRKTLNLDRTTIPFSERRAG